MFLSRVFRELSSWLAYRITPLNTMFSGEKTIIWTVTRLWARISQNLACRMISEDKLVL